MMMPRYVWLILLALAGCGQSEQAMTPVANEEQPTIPVPGTGPDANTPLAPAKSPQTSLAEPKGPIDPKSAQAAGQVVQQYAALIEQGRWTASRVFWSSDEAAKTFERNFRAYADVHSEIGELGEPEGAAGSIYVTEPITFYGRKNGGGDYRRPATVTLRRVNDVPGSTAEQRRWHIERIDWIAG